MSTQLAFPEIETQFAFEDLLEQYPTGRKHCSMCGCWRHLIDFGVGKWTNYTRTVPRYLLSRCRICMRNYQREKHGHIPLELGAHPPGHLGEFDAQRFVELLNPKKLPVRVGDNVYLAWHVNGIRLSPSETRNLWRWKNGVRSTVLTETVDAWATKFGIPLWEIEEFAKIAA